MIPEPGRRRRDETRGQGAIERALTPRVPARPRRPGPAGDGGARGRGADADLIVLEAHLAAVPLRPPAPDLARMAVAGRA